MSSQNIIHVTESNFDFEVLEYSQHNPVVVDFWAEWCVPCKMLDPILQKLAEENHGEFRLAKVNIDENQQLAYRFNIRSIPMVKAFRNGEIVSEFSGMLPEPKIREFLNRVIPKTSDLQLDKANSLLLAENWEPAIEAFRAVLENQPGHPNALLGLAKSLLATGCGSEARDVLVYFPVSYEFSTAEKLKPLSLVLCRKEPEFSDSDTPVDAMYHRTIRLVKMGNFPAAMDGILEILRQDKNYKNGEARQVILGLFEILGHDHPTTREYQTELASILF